MVFDELDGDSSASNWGVLVSQCFREVFAKQSRRRGGSLTAEQRATQKTRVGDTGRRQTRCPEEPVGTDSRVPRGRETNCKKSPESDRWPEFVSAVAARLQAGAREYGDRSFHRPPTELVGEIEEELLDVCAWTFILWTRVRAIRKKAKRVL